MKTTNKKSKSFNILNIVKKNFSLFILIILSSFIFFYRLDYNTLASWDEAWYGSIAREIIKSGDFMNLIWNGKPYYDHPPMGFWIMALSYKFFGITEFSTRLPSAVLGLLSIILLYKIGEMFFNNKAIGFVASLILGTSVWYVLRVRSGNLESVFVFFYLLTVFLAIKSAKNFRWFPLVGFSFGGLVLTKTLVGASALPLILLMNWKQLLQAFKNKENLIWVVIAVIIFFGIVNPWYSLHLNKYSDFYNYHFVHKGMRNKELSSYFQLLLSQPLFYLHMGVRKWYRLWQAGIVSVLFINIYYILQLFKQKGEKIRRRLFSYFFVLIWNLIVLYPFLTSEKTELWHLIPVYVPLSLIVAIGVYDGLTFCFNILEWIIRHSGLSGIVVNSKQRFWMRFKKSSLTRMTKILPDFLYLVFFLYIAFLQIKIFYKEVFPESKYVTSEADISKKLAKYKQRIYVENDYLPIAVFYSGRELKTLVLEADAVTTFTKLFEIDNGSVVGVTRNWVVEDLLKKNFPVKILEKNNTYSILTKP